MPMTSSLSVISFITSGHKEARRFASDGEQPSIASDMGNVCRGGSPFSPKKTGNKDALPEISATP